MTDEKTPYQLRKERSNAMLENGIEPVKDGYEYFIPSQSEQGKKYHVTICKGWYSCECHDNKAGNLCKHILFLKTWFALRFQQKEHKVEVAHPCPNCESKVLRKFGTRKTTMGRKQIWKCLSCTHRFVNTPVQKIKGDTEAVITAIDLSMKGVSLRGIADSLKQLYGLEVTHVTVMNWVQKYMVLINAHVAQFKPSVGDVWHADEQFIKARGKQEYVWNVLDGDTRFLLAAHESPTRNYGDARATFQEAKATAGKKARTVVTDGAFSYERAVRKEFATRENPKPHHRYISLREKDASNNKIERYHGTFRQRDKVMKGFGGNQASHAANFRTYYNFVKPHHAHNGRTPAQAAGIPQDPRWREILLRSLGN